MIERRTLVLGAALAAAGCRPRWSLPWANGDLTPAPRAVADGRLLRKALDFEAAMTDHLTPEGLVLTERPEPLPPRDPLNAQDAAIWTGCYAAAEAFRAQVAPSDEGAARLAQVIGGLHLLQDATGVPGVLARMVKRAAAPMPGETATWSQGRGEMAAYRWMGDVSVDQYAGVLFGYDAAYDALDEAAREGVAAHVAGLVDRLIRFGWRITGPDGRPTKHSDLSGGALTEPLNALLALAFAKIAWRVTGEARFDAAYRSLIDRGYVGSAVAARDRWWEYLFGVNHSDNNLAYLAWYPLIRAETDPALSARYRDGLRRTWRVVRAEANPFFTYITHAVDIPGWRDEAALSRAVDTLRRFPFPKRDEPRDLSARRGVCRSWFDDRHGDPQSCEPVPIDLRARSSFEWSSNPYRLDRRGDARTRLAGVDYLVAYWLGRRHGLIDVAQ